MSQWTEEQLLEVVRTVWEQRDPLPEGLVARLQEATALVDGDVDLELMLLVERSDELVGARGAGTAYTLRFAHGGVDLLLRISSDGDVARVDGWVVPPTPLTVRTRRDEEPERTLAVPDTGRFELADLTRGLLRLRLEPYDGSPPFETPAFEI